jgi:3',5'-cyclic AMP phosphodiesterase CpdA
VRATALALLLAVPASAAGPVEVRVAFVGDSGTGDDEQRAVAAQMAKLKPSLVFLLGDNIYDRGSRASIKSRFDDPYRELLRGGAQFHAALGNHDVLWCEARERDPLPADGSAYARLALPCDVQFQLSHPDFGYVGGRRYYSVVSDSSPQPMVEVFVLDSNTLATSQSKLHGLRQDRAQLEWLEKSLAASRARWKVVTMHHPPHSPTTPLKYFWIVPLGGGRTREFRLDLQLSSILRSGGVDVVFTGHNHFYARMVPQNGIRYFVSGGGGKKVYGFESRPDYVAAGGGFFHFVYVRATEGAFEWYTIDDKGASRDAGWFGKGSVADMAFPSGTLPPPAAP